MADTFQKIFNSSTFTFLVGSDKKPIVVHSAAIGKHSKVLHSLMNIGMSESLSQEATLEDIREEDFIRFCQFAYMGDYSNPPYEEEHLAEAKQMQACDSLPTEQPPLKASDLLPWDNDVTSSTVKKKSRKVYEIPAPEEPPSRKAPSAAIESSKLWSSWRIDVTQVGYQSIPSLRTKFENREFCTKLPRLPLISSCQPPSNNQHHHNYKPVFLAHIRLYIFADKYDIGVLQQLVLHKLHKTLLNFKLHPERVKDVVELVRYVYSDKNPFNEGANDLRSLVAVYIASRVDELNQSDAFMALLKDGGAFMSDFWLLVRNAFAA